MEATNMSEMIRPFIAPVQISIPEMMLKLDSVMMDKFVWIGIMALACGAWHMSKYSHTNTPQTAFITGLIDMAAFASGIAALGFYAVFKGWL
jgi:hypothetical protein